MTNQKGFTPILILVIILIIAGMIGVYYVGTLQGKLSALTPIPQTMIPESPTPGAMMNDSISDWKTFTTQDNKYTLMYPADWTLKDESMSLDLYQDGNNQFSQRVVISKDGYSFHSINPLAWGPGACLYSDSEPFDGPAQNFGDFVDISTSDYSYRRPKTPNENGAFTICSRKLGSTDLFGNVAGFGTAWYEVPQNYDESYLSTLDKIFQSLKVNQ